MCGFVPTSEIKNEVGKYRGKMLISYVAEVICVVSGHQDEYLRFANSMHKNVQFRVVKEKKE